MICEQRGVDGNKKINGRKRQILVDVLGRIWKVKVHAAHNHDSPEGVALLNEIAEELPRLKKVWQINPIAEHLPKQLRKLD